MTTINSMSTRERELSDALYEIGGLLIEARVGVPHDPATIRGAILAADAARLRSADAHGWGCGSLADQFAEAEERAQRLRGVANSDPFGNDWRES